jgi:hypothetical protein
LIVGQSLQAFKLRMTSRSTEPRIYASEFSSEPTEEAARILAAAWLVRDRAIAMVVSIWAVVEARRTRTLSMTPLVGSYIQDDVAESPLGVFVENSGPGVAQVKSIAYYVDGHRIESLGEALAAAHVQPRAEHDWELEPNDSLGVGREVWIVQFRFRKNADQAGTFADFLSDRFGIQIEYCAVDGKHCRTTCSLKDRCGK